MQLMKINFLLSLFILNFLIPNTNGLDIENKKYNWLCKKNEKCVRQSQLNATDSKTANNLAQQNTISFNSHNACSLICGRYGSLWPRPTGSVMISNKLIEINPSKIIFDKDNVPPTIQSHLDKVNKLMLDNILKECSRKNCSQAISTKVVIKAEIASESTKLTWNIDESYLINVLSNIRNSQLDNENEPEVTVTIKAHNVFGYRHGLETLSQLITESNNILVMVSEARIRDRPKFTHRGLMLDTARNFIPVKDIERTLDGMAASKLNVFHWHATDSQSFPLETPRVPHMANYGAYTSDNIYKQSDIHHIIKYAKYRGIRVIIELDAPSHAGNGWQWGPHFGLGDLAVCINQQPWRNYCIQPPCGQLNPTNANVFEVLKNIYSDLLDVLPVDEVMHMGGDEVHFGCWNSSAQILDYLYNRGMGRENKDFLQLWSEFHSNSLKVWDELKNKVSTVNEDDKLTPLKSKVILWSSHLTNPETIETYLPNNRYIIQTWVPTTDDLPKQLIAKGYDIIMSTKNAWYFDHGFWGTTQYYNWRTVYKNRIPQTAGVLGGEACVWTELIDSNSLDSRVWPRAAAVAERLWTDPETDAYLAETRFYKHRKRLINLGIKAEAVAPKWCLQNEGECT